MARGVCCALLFAAAAVAVAAPAAAAASRCDPPPGDAALAAALRSGASVFFVRALAPTGSSDVSDVERCALEAALAARPARPVVFFVAELDCAAAPALTSLLGEADNLWVVRLDYTQLFAPYPGLAAWHAGRAWAVPAPRTRGAHLADAVRLALLHSYGGTYMDIDELLLRPSALSAIGERALGAEEPWVLNSAVLAFPAGHAFVGAAIAEFAATFDANFWGFNGPRLVTRVWAALAASSIATVNVSIFAPHVLYPLHHSNVAALFRPLADAPAAPAAAICRAHALHLWNHLVGPRLQAVGDCGANADAFHNTLLGGIMAGTCPSTLSALRARCSPPAPATWSAWWSAPAAAAASSVWETQLCAGVPPAPAAPVFTPLDDASELALPPTGLTLTAWVRGPAAAPARAAAAAAASAGAAEADSLALAIDCGATAAAAAPASCRILVSAGAAPLLRSSSPLVPGRWHFVALTYDAAASRVTLFVDGIQQLQRAPAVGAGGMDGKQASAVVPVGSQASRVDFDALLAVTPVEGAAATPAALSFAELAAEHNAQRARFEAPALPLPASDADAAASELAVADADVDLVSVVHPDWTGVLHSHRRVPQFFGKTLLVRSLAFEPDATALLTRLAAMPALREFVVNSVLDGTADFAARLRAVRPDVEVAVVIHSAPSSPYHFLEAENIGHVVRAAQPRADGTASAVTRMGFVKFGMAGLFRDLGVCAYDLSNFPPTHAEEHRAAAAASSGAASTTFTINAAAMPEGAVLNVFIPGVGSAKNQAAQILAACVLPGVVVHLIDTPSTAYLRACPAPVIVHGKLAAAPFAALLARMDVVMYVSLTECSPGVVLESVAAGVPCITGATSPIYAPDADLSALLVVNAPDDPAIIRDTLARVLGLVRDDAAAAALRARLLRLADSATALAAATWTAFLDGRNASASCPAAGAAGSFVSLDTNTDAALSTNAQAKWSGQNELSRMKSDTRRRLDESFSASASFSPTITPSGTPTAGYSTSSVSTISIYMSNVNCAQASTPAVLDSLAETERANMNVPSTWVNVSAVCVTAGSRARMLQSFSGVVFLISITIPGYASAAQVASVTANVVWASTATTAQINAAIADTLAQLALVGATSPQAVGVIVAVNGEACTGQACSALISPSSSASTVNVGAIIGGVIGGVAALVIFVGLVIACRMGAFGDRRATGSGYAASAYDTAPGGGVGGGRALPAYVMNAAAYKPSSARSF